MPKKYSEIESNCWHKKHYHNREGTLLQLSACPLEQHLFFIMWVYKSVVQFVLSFCRAAARCNKGIEVLFAVALEHFVLVQVRVLRGPSSADDTVKKIRYLIHCQWCEERIFKREGNMIEGNPIL